MDHRDHGNGIAVVRPLPRQELFDSAQAAAHLGLTPGLFRALRFFRCGPAPLRIQSRIVYRRTELDRLRHEWCTAVQVRAEDRLSLSPNPDQPPARTPYQSRSLPYPLDPLMRILALRAIRHRIVVSILWVMAIIGGGISLIFY
ncbi:hypothetical protein C0V97_00730 [Asaia sp. W19]|uniref:hypothetical protein n=1 Tax=unclassified Asaia TaxID=2685023 RepID=UPI000F8DFDC3|nr:hypothetical protein [Asaia sp. W19]RUT27629.1 hypothetical protein C0V97_00730 [Asaia sp. W19]